MPTDSLTADGRPAWRRGWPELLVGLLSAVIFLGCLGSVDVWGKREQRASAEAIDTVEHGHWLVAEIQGRPRLEKPPLPRWIIAGLIRATGRRDEWIVRLPSAACGLATVALIYALGRWMCGRPVGLASAMILGTSGLFVGEMRQAGNDGPLALFTTLALVAAWRLLDTEEPAALSSPRARRAWRILFYTALGLGFLSKGPIVLMLTLAAIVPFLIQGRRLVAGLRRLFDAPGLLLFAAMAASWPLAVAWRDPNAWGVWLTEMSEKTGVFGTLVHRPYALLARHWPGMMFPWSILAMAAVILPFLPSASRPDVDAGRSAEARGPAGPSRRPSPCWFAWWWAVGNMAIFCLWTVAKPNYYVPCMPGMALLAGWAWVRLARGAQAPPARGGGLAARLVLQAQWVLFFVGGAVAPIVVRPWILRSLWPWTLVLAAVLSVAIVVSVIAWRRGAGAMALAPITAAWALGIVVVYGLLAPADNPLRSHRELARALDRLVPPGRPVHPLLQ